MMDEKKVILMLIIFLCFEILYALRFFLAEWLIKIYEWMKKRSSKKPPKQGQWESAC